MCGMKRVRIELNEGWAFSQKGRNETVTLPHCWNGADTFEQGVAYYRGKPILYSVGNFLMRMVTGKPWTEFGMLARLRFESGKSPHVDVCPYRVWGFDPLPLVGDEKEKHYVPAFRFTFPSNVPVGQTIAMQAASNFFGAWDTSVPLLRAG